MKLTLTERWREKAANLKLDAIDADLRGSHEVASGLRDEAQVYLDCADELEKAYPRNAWDPIQIRS